MARETPSPPPSGSTHRPFSDKDQASPSSPGSHRSVSRDAPSRKDARRSTSRSRGEEKRSRTNRRSRSRSRSGRRHKDYRSRRNTSRERRRRESRSGDGRKDASPPSHQERRGSAMDHKRNGSVEPYSKSREPREKTRESSRDRRRDRSEEKRNKSKDRRRDRSRDTRRERSRDRQRDRSKDRRHADSRERKRDRSGERRRDRSRSRDRRDKTRKGSSPARRSASPLPYRPAKRRSRSPSPYKPRTKYRSRSPKRRKRTHSRSRSPSRSRSRSPVRRSKKPLPSQEVSFRGLDNSDKPPTKYGGAPSNREKPNFRTTGLLAREANRVEGTKISLKYHEPPEARKPPASAQWRLFVFKGEEAVDTIELYQRSCWLLGRATEVADIPLLHPSSSQQHAAIQFRYVQKTVEDEYGVRQKKGKVKPYIIDLESSNGTLLNEEPVEPGRYVELRDKDMLQFAGSEREYVIMLPPKET